MHTLITRDRAAGSALTVAPSTGRPHFAAVIRIAFGLVWAVDATFKWRPGFVHGQVLARQFAKHDQVTTPVIHQWIQLWSHLAAASPPGFAIGTAVVETLIALGLLTGTFSNAVFVGSAIYSFGVWSAAEAFGLPWNRPGITDVGPSAAYVIASLALLCCAAGTTWSVDQVIRPKLGRLRVLSN